MASTKTTPVSPPFLSSLHFLPLPQERHAVKEEKGGGKAVQKGSAKEKGTGECNDVS